MSTTTTVNNQMSPLGPLLTVDKQPDELLSEIMALGGFINATVGQQTPLFALTPHDRGGKDCEREETDLEGERISCFAIGGELRLCFPQILNAILRDVTLPEINKAFTDLHIHSSKCTKEQLEQLKTAGVMPPGAEGCGLITRSDAERLIHVLLASRERPKMLLTNHNLRLTAIPVMHDCFGGARGLALPQLYTNPNAECVECDTCAELFSPRKFITHTHRPGLENNFCHWGFDSRNWPAYLHPVHANNVLHTQTLDGLKQKFANIPLPPSSHQRTTIVTSHKRLADPADAVNNIVSFLMVLRTLAPLGQGGRKAPCGIFDAESMWRRRRRRKFS